MAVLHKWNQQGMATLQKWRKPASIANTPWNRATSNDFQQGPAAFTATISPTAPPAHATSTLLASKENIVPEANMSQQLISLSPTDPAGPVYRPGDLRPMTMALPKQIMNQQVSDPTPYPATSNMNPLPLDALDLAYESTESMKPGHTPGELVPPIIPEALIPTRVGNLPIATLMENTPMSATAEKASAKLPDIADDPMLENVMRQAQLGLFVTPGHEKS
jgi:hypothetical protein